MSFFKNTAGNGLNFSEKTIDGTTVNIGGSGGGSGGSGGSGTFTDVSVSNSLNLNNSLVVWNKPDGNYLINGTSPKSIITGTGNVSLGLNSLDSVNIGNNNLCIGQGAGAKITSGSKNIAIGMNSLNNETTSGGNLINGNIAIGHRSMEFSNNVSNNIGIGLETLKNNTFGTKCIAIGTASLRDLNSANSNDNVSIGYEANMTNTGGYSNVAIGSSTSNAGFNNSTVIGTGAINTANNQISLGRASETVSCPNTLSFVMTDDNTPGNYFIPFSKSLAGTEGQLYVDSITGPLSYNPNSSILSCINMNPTNAQISSKLTISPNAYITWAETNKNYLINDMDPKTITTGTDNCCLGFNALDNVSSGSHNIGIGQAAGKFISTTSNNVAIGGLTMNAVGCTASDSVAIGYNALSAVTTGTGNVCIGSNAGSSITTTTNCFALGFNSLKATNGSGNIGIGANTGLYLTTGFSNISIGTNTNADSGQTSQNNSTAIGSASSNANFSNSVCLGVSSRNTASNQIMLGTATEITNTPGGLINGKTLSTSTTTAPSTTSHLGYMALSKTTGWTTAITSTATATLNSFTIDGTTIAYGTYMVMIYLTITNGTTATEYNLACNTTTTQTYPVSCSYIGASATGGLMYQNVFSVYGASATYNVLCRAGQTGATGTLIVAGAGVATIMLTRIA